MAQFLLSVWHDGPFSEMDVTPEQMQQMFKDVDEFNQKITANGKWVFGGGLEDHATARVVRSDAVTDGPYSEVKEQMGGFWVLECADLDEAMALAKEASVACQGPVEVRPFQAEPEA